jgi:hypothetical protein
MPDQHAAASEHELITTITEPLGQLPDDPLAEVAADFPIALRGYDRFAVDAYVDRTTELVAELQSTRSPEAAVRRALERVGEEISGILQRAHDTADEITARSRSEAEERLETARREATELTAAAERRVKDLDVETERIWAERHGIVTDVSELARRLSELAGTALERFPPVDLPPAVAEPSAEDGVGGADTGEVPEPAHVFDGALDVLDPPELITDERPTVEQSIAEDPAPPPTEGGESIPDQPTGDMPPLEPWPADEAPVNPE